jgi:hypothetical protein
MTARFALLGGIRLSASQTTIICTKYILKTSEYTVEFGILAILTKRLKVCLLEVGSLELTKYRIVLAMARVCRSYWTLLVRCPQAVCMTL